MNAFNNELVRGTLKTLVLKVLNDNSKMYGYQLIKEVKRRTDEKISINESALYPLLHKLQEDGLVSMKEQNSSNRIRKYYKLTKKGKTASEEKTIELLEFMKTMAGFIKGQA